MKKKIRLIIFDFNGVTVKGDHKQTARHFGKVHGTPWEKVHKILYTKYFNLIVENKISEREGWVKPIQELGWDQDWRAMRQWHIDHQYLQKSVITLVQQLRQRGYIYILLSKNLIRWFAYLEKRLRFKKYFDTSINTQALNLPKASKKTMQYISRRFKVRPEEIVYIEDQANNLVEPKKMGVHTILYKNFRLCKKSLTKILKEKNPD